MQLTLDWTGKLPPETPSKTLPKSVSGQSKFILDYLESGNEITPLDALRMFGCFRLGARIFDLKALGYNIETNMITKDGKTFASYKLRKE